MNRVRCFLFATIVVLSSATFTLGGDIQGPGKSEPSPPLPASASATDSTSGTTGTSTSTEPIQIAEQDLATTILTELLLTIY